MSLRCLITRDRRVFKRPHKNDHQLISISFLSICLKQTKEKQKSNLINHFSLFNRRIHTYKIS
jgi:hypothetical protein